MRTSLMILAAASLLLFPFVTRAMDNGPQESQTYDIPPVAQPLVREGDFAIRLAALYGLGAPANETEAEDLLSFEAVCEKGRKAVTDSVAEFAALTALSEIDRLIEQEHNHIVRISKAIKELTDIIRSYGGRIASIMGSYERVPAGQRLVYLRVYDVDRAKLAELQDDLQKKAVLIYVVDHRENKRKVFRNLEG